MYLINDQDEDDIFGRGAKATKQSKASHNLQPLTSPFIQRPQSENGSASARSSNSRGDSTVMEDRKSATGDEDLDNTINPDAAHHPMIDQDLYNDIEQFAQNQ